MTMIETTSRRTEMTAANAQQFGRGDSIPSDSVFADIFAVESRAGRGVEPESTDRDADPDADTGAQAGATDARPDGVQPVGTQPDGTQPDGTQPDDAPDHDAPHGDAHADEAPAETTPVDETAAALAIATLNPLHPTEPTPTAASAADSATVDVDSIEGGVVESVSAPVDQAAAAAASAAEDGVSLADGPTEPAQVSTASDSEELGVLIEADATALDATAEAEPMVATAPDRTRPTGTAVSPAVTGEQNGDMTMLEADAAAPLPTDTLGADAKTAANPAARLAEHLATREVMDRIDRHRLLRDGTLEIDVTTERYGVLRVEAIDGRDGVRLSLQGDEATPQDLADLADDLRQAFRDEGVDLADVDVRDGSRGSADQRRSPDDAGVVDGVLDDPLDPDLDPVGAAPSGLDLRL